MTVLGMRKSAGLPTSPCSYLKSPPAHVPLCDHRGSGRFVITGALPALVGASGSDRPALPCGRLCLREETDRYKRSSIWLQEGESSEQGTKSRPGLGGSQA